jgi:3-oxoacyl-[acyl-carrier protein] reductase
VSRRVLVTGASRGIGRAIAVLLAGQGFEVAVHYRTGAAQARETRVECDKRQASVDDVREASMLAFDIADREACERVLLADLDANGPFWGVVCNAGVTADGPFPGMKPDAWDQVVHTNLDGFYNVLRPLVMPMVRARQGGRIVTLSSVSGIIGNRGQVNYSASKAGIIGATKALAQELAKRQITVNSVAPGLIDTDMLEGAPVEEILKAIPMRRLGRPEEVAAAVGYLFSDAAGYVTGQVLSVNGGLA